MILPALTACVLAVSAAPAKPKNPADSIIVTAAGDRVTVKWPGYEATADRVLYEADQRHLVLRGTDARPVIVVGHGATYDRIVGVNVVVHFADGAITSSGGR